MTGIVALLMTLGVIEGGKKVRKKKVRSSEEEVDGSDSTQEETDRPRAL